MMIRTIIILLLCGSAVHAQQSEVKEQQGLWGQTSDTSTARDLPQPVKKAIVNIRIPTGIMPFIQAAPPLTIQEADGSPKQTNVTKLIFPNGSLTRSGTQLTYTGAGTVTGTYTINQGTLTASTPVWTHTATWNNAGVSFINWTSNITVTAAASQSKHIRIQENGADVFAIYKGGSVYSVAFVTFDPNTGNELSAFTSFDAANSGMALASAGHIWWTSGSNWYDTQDTGLNRGAPGVVRFHATDPTVGGTYGAIARTPAQITADQNNYNPGGTSYLQRWSSDASRNVTGLTFSTIQVDGQTHVICNVGAQNIVLVHQSASSTAANRFFNSTAANLTVSANKCADVIYDNTTGAWRASLRN